MSRRYISLSDSQGSYCDICKGRGYTHELATVCVKYETDALDPPNHIRSSSQCTSCATEPIKMLGDTDKDFRYKG